jgi:hypothetical protein
MANYVLIRVQIIVHIPAKNVIDIVRRPGSIIVNYMTRVVYLCGFLRFTVLFTVLNHEPQD